MRPGMSECTRGEMVGIFSLRFGQSPLFCPLDFVPRKPRTQALCVSIVLGRRFRCAASWQPFSLCDRVGTRKELERTKKSTTTSHRFQTARLWTEASRQKANEKPCRATSESKAQHRPHRSANTQTDKRSLETIVWHSVKSTINVEISNANYAFLSILPTSFWPDRSSAFWTFMHSVE